MTRELDRDHESLEPDDEILKIILRQFAQAGQINSFQFFKKLIGADSLKNIIICYYMIFIS